MTTAPAWDPYQRDCPSRQVLDRIGDRWSVLIIMALADGPMRYTELSRRLDGVSQKMLTQTLRGLERDGMVSRTVHPVIPPRVDYALTDLGRTLRRPISALETWAIDHMDVVLAARERYDATASAEPS